MNQKVFENSVENEEFFNFMEGLWNIATEYAQGMPPAFDCVTDTGKHLVIVPYFLIYRHDKKKHAMEVSYMDFGKAKYDIDTNIIQSSGF